MGGVRHTAAKCLHCHAGLLPKGTVPTLTLCTGTRLTAGYRYTALKDATRLIDVSLVGNCCYFMEPLLIPMECEHSVEIALS